jgi:hypothetical protein
MVPTWKEATRGMLNTLEASRPGVRQAWIQVKRRFGANRSGTL